MPAHIYRVNDPVRFLSSRGEEEGFIVNIRGSKADVVVADGTEYRVSKSFLRIRKGIAPKRVFTKDQMERLGFEIGDVVTFSANDGTKISGFIQRLNPQRARVHSDDSVWHVPYPFLEKERAEEQALKIDGNSKKLQTTQTSSWINTACLRGGFVTIMQQGAVVFAPMKTIQLACRNSSVSNQTKKR